MMDPNEEDKFDKFLAGWYHGDWPSIIDLSLSRLPVILNGTG